jgi:hypothetical protein
LGPEGRRFKSCITDQLIKKEDINMSLTVAKKAEVSETVARLFRNGNTPLKEYGIYEKLIREVEAKYPNITKQYP